MNHKLTALILSTSLFAPLIGSAAVVFEDNFNEYAAGSDLDGLSGSEWNVYNNTETETDVFTVQQDTANYFGQGTSSNYMRMAITNEIVQKSTAVSSKSFTENTLTGQVSYRFYDPTDASSTGDGWAIRIGPGSGNGVTSFSLIMDEGSLYAGTGTSVGKGDVLLSYDMDTAYTVTIVFNNSADTISYAGGSIASKTMDVYVDGVRVGTNLAGSGTEGTTSTSHENIASVNFTSKSWNAFADTLYIDDVEVSTDISIPEPSTSAFLIGMSVLLITFLRRRLKGARS
ncbi:hypothetical protein [Ruficoccus sp. ZRK36]|uniref:hypothetical protein n=1 Tax=Ruficoccus sp. ZRK36 TaxID=2866311 RepID=UPI001C72C23D|nr:hypothetical protein [Ruficoccus sp. ZRK36]QYY35062.1 hypothetical protein K0V07_12215 [Ruficoccus sp. ZRK36]